MQNSDCFFVDGALSYLYNAIAEEENKVDRDYFLTNMQYS